MTGTKGRSGGPRKGAGGARPGAGRPPGKSVKLNTPATNDPLIFLQGVMNDASLDARLRTDAAKALLPFVHAKKGELGKKADAAIAAKKVAAGRFAPAAPPKLVFSRWPAS